MFNPKEGPCNFYVERDRGAGGVWEVRGERAGSGIPKVAGTGRKEDNFAILHNILQ